VFEIGRIGKIGDASGFEESNLDGRRTVNRLPPDIRDAVAQLNKINRLAVGRPFDVVLGNPSRFSLFWTGAGSVLINEPSANDAIAIFGSALFFGFSHHTKAMRVLSGETTGQCAAPDNFVT